jgi:hypothetical protein
MLVRAAIGTILLKKTHRTIFSAFGLRHGLQIRASCALN